MSGRGLVVELPESERRKAGQDNDERDQQIAALTEIVGVLAQNLRRLEGQVNRVARIVTEAPSAAEQEDPSAPAAWVWFNPPAATEDEPDGDQDPRVTVENFVIWYNQTFVGIDGGRSKPIPVCWRQHPGLAMEVATPTVDAPSTLGGLPASARHSTGYTNGAPDSPNALRATWHTPTALTACIATSARCRERIVLPSPNGLQQPAGKGYRFRQTRENLIPTWALIT
jgi:hypothetical protein